MPANIQNVLAYYTRKGVFNHPPPVQPDEILQEVLQDPGSSPSHNMAVDGTTPVKFYYDVPADKIAVIRTHITMIQDDSMLPSGFGGLGILTNGCDVEAVDVDKTTIIFDPTMGFGVKRNSDFSHFARFDIKDDPGAGDDLLMLEWKMPAPLTLTEGQRMQVVVNDNLAGITHWHWILQGYLLDATKG